jgi:hypothetical protein
MLLRGGLSAASLFSSPYELFIKAADIFKSIENANLK